MAGQGIAHGSSGCQAGASAIYFVCTRQYNTFVCTRQYIHLCALGIMLREH